MQQTILLLYESLINAGANINIVSNINNELGIPLLHACHHTNIDIDIVKLLINHQTDLNITNREKNNALMVRLYNCCNNNPEKLFDTIKLLIHFGSDTNIKNIYGCTALMIACSELTFSSIFDTCVIKLLIDKCNDIDTKCNHGYTALLYFLKNNSNSECVCVLKLFMEAHANVNIVNDDGNSALMMVCNHENYTSYTIDVVKSLIAMGSDTNIINVAGETALMHARNKINHKNSEIIIQQLINAGADVNVVCNRNTSLTIAHRHSDKLIHY